MEPLHVQPWAKIKPKCMSKMEEVHSEGKGRRVGVLVVNSPGAPNDFGFLIFDLIIVPYFSLYI